jgi:ribosomal protein S18 acetylase RimI-like enzyme
MHLLISPAVAEQAGSIADILIRSRAAFMPYAPSAHSDAEVRAWVRDRLLPGGGVTVATLDARVVGMLAVSTAAGCSWVEQMYVCPSAVDQGVGTRLLVRALRALPPPVRLYTFQANGGARRFYERHGFVAIASTDGAGNEERCPDVLHERKAGTQRPRRVLRAALTPLAGWPTPGLREPLYGDRAALARLMRDAYRDSVDDEGEGEGEALVEIDRVLAGAYGAFVPQASSVVEREGRLHTATLVTRWEARPFVALSMTDPGARRCGLARAGLVNAMRRLHATGETELRLVVTLANVAAVRLYRSLGFAEVAA